MRWPDGSELVCRGECPGYVTATEQGTRGFGYDAVFAPTFVPAPGSGSPEDAEQPRLLRNDDDGAMRTFAEMTEAEKNAVSHRGRAFRMMAEALAERFGSSGQRA